MREFVRVTKMPECFTPTLFARGVEGGLEFVTRLG
jgi:hypothetical protein